MLHWAKVWCQMCSIVHVQETGTVEGDILVAKRRTYQKVSVMGYLLCHSCRAHQSQSHGSHTVKEFQKLIWGMTGKENASIIWTQSKMLCEDQANGENVRLDGYLQASFSKGLLADTFGCRGTVGDNSG